MNSLLSYSRTEVNGADVLRLRQSLNISQDKLAKILDVASATIYVWEKFRSKISPRNQHKILEIFDYIKKNEQGKEK